MRKLGRRGKETDSKWWWGTESLDAKGQWRRSVQLPPYTDKETKAGGASMLFSSIHPTPLRQRSGAGVHHMVAGPDSSSGLPLRSGLRVSPCSPADILEYYTLTPQAINGDFGSFLPGCLSTRTSWYPEQIGRRLIAHSQPA